MNGTSPKTLWSAPRVPGLLDPTRPLSRSKAPAWRFRQPGRPSALSVAGAGAPGSSRVSRRSSTSAHLCAPLAALGTVTRGGPGLVEAGPDYALGGCLGRAHSEDLAFALARARREHAGKGGPGRAGLSSTRSSAGSGPGTRIPGPTSMGMFLLSRILTDKGVLRSSASKSGRALPLSRNRYLTDLLEYLAIAYRKLRNTFQPKKGICLNFVCLHSASSQHPVLLHFARRNPYGNSGNGTNALTGQYEVSFNGEHTSCSWFVQV